MAGYREQRRQREREDQQALNALIQQYLQALGEASDA